MTSPALRLCGARWARATVLSGLGKNDPFFLPIGAEAFKRDLPLADVRFFDTGHFALETHCSEIAKVIVDFLDATKSKVA
jgi:hypothetical protein